MRLEYIDCPYCGGNDPQPWASENGHSAVRCKRCDFVYLNPRPTEESITEATKTGLHTIEEGELNDVGGFRRYRVKGFINRLHDLFPDNVLDGKAIRWLDIGAGFGELLLALNEITEKQSSIVGVEPNRIKVNKAKQLGLDIKQSLDETNGAYDYISLINVFSHLPDPRQFFSYIAQKLTPGGEVVVVTGNGGDLEAAEYQGDFYFPDHLTFAGEKHILGILERSGFELVCMRQYPEFLPESLMIRVARAAIHKQAIIPHSRFRFMWLRGRMKHG